MTATLKRIVPRVVADLVVNGRRDPAPTFVWEGIYGHRRDVPVITERGYDDVSRIEEMVSESRRFLHAVRNGQKIYIEWHDALGVLTSMLLKQQASVRILDFGGGIGPSFIQLLSTVGVDANIQYDVVDLDDMATAGSILFADEPRISFHTALPDARRAVDIVYASGVLPYIEDYAALLRQLAALDAPYLLLSRLAAGTFPAFAARQLNLPGQVLAYWFLNVTEIAAILNSCGYFLLFDGLVGPAYDQTNYPASHRMGRMRTMLFGRR
jgi:putative methyltransferase (TIGR04325 family)